MVEFLGMCGRFLILLVDEGCEGMLGDADGNIEYLLNVLYAVKVHFFLYEEVAKKLIQFFGEYNRFIG